MQSSPDVPHPDYCATEAVETHREHLEPMATRRVRPRRQQDEPRRPDVSAEPTCRFCCAPLSTTFVDLGMSPLCESFLSADAIRRAEVFYPLHVFVCDSCSLVQLEAFVPPAEIFTEYAYFSSYSSAWVEHARR